MVHATQVLAYSKGHAYSLLKSKIKKSNKKTKKIKKKKSSLSFTILIYTTCLLHINLIDNI